MKLQDATKRNVGGGSQRLVRPLATDEDWFKHRHWVDHPDGSSTREKVTTTTPALEKKVK